MDIVTRPPTPWDVSREAFPREGSEADRLRFLLRYAVLAPSTRNTQPWRFRVEDDRIELHADLERWQRVADPDQREIFISLGCALENLLIAARHFGYRSTADYLSGVDEATPAVRVRVEPGVPMTVTPDPRFEALCLRRTNHGVYDGSPVAADDLAALAEACSEPELRLHWITDAEGRAQVDDLVMRADAELLSDPDYLHELGEVIGTGAFGTPWLLATIGRFAVAHLPVAARMARADHLAVMSAPAIGIICAHASTRPAQVRVGQVLERIYLTATVRGLSLQPISQLLQVEAVREALSAMLPGASAVPLQPFRIGRASAPRVHTPRRDVDEVVRR